MHVIEEEDETYQDGASVVQRRSLVKAVSAKDITLANGEKVIRRSVSFSKKLEVPPKSPKLSPREKETPRSTNVLTALARKKRSITLSVSAPQISLPQDVRTHFRERSNSEPLHPNLVFKPLDEMWEDTLNNWNEMSLQKGVLSTLLYKRGVPVQRRGEIWKRLSKLIADTELLTCSQDDSDHSDDHKCIYKRLLDLKNTVHEPQITADITRTFPTEKSIYDPEFQKSLFNVLKAFSLYDEDVGYCQGLSFVAALLLMQVKEEQAFFMLIRLLKGHNLRSFYTQDMRGVRLRMFQMNKITQALFPRIHKHMEELGVSIAVVTTPWFMTAFGYQLPLDVALRVTDVLLLEGIPALFRIALAILVLCEQEIMDLGVDDVMDYFRSDLREKFQDPQELMDTANKVNVSLSQLEMLEVEFLQNESLEDKISSDFDSSMSEEEIVEKQNTLRFSQVLVDSHELKERLVRKNVEYDNLVKQFEQFKKKAEDEKIALVGRLGKLLDKVNVTEAENAYMTEKLVKAEVDLRQTKLQCTQLTNCNYALSQELYKLKRKTGGDIISIMKRSGGIS